MADYAGYDAFCRYCGKPIIFIRTVNGKLMPCDATPVKYWLSDDHRGVMIFQRNGTYARAVLDGLPSLCSGGGYRPHWASCTKQRKQREKTDKPPERKLSQAAQNIRDQVQRERAAREAREAKLTAKREADAKLREAEAAQVSLFER